MSLLRRTAIAIAAAVCMAAVPLLTTTMPASAHTGTAATAAKLATAAKPATAAKRDQPCANGVGYSGGHSFWRCTGTSNNSRWVGSSCNPGQYNAGTEYNV